MEGRAVIDQIIDILLEQLVLVTDFEATGIADDLIYSRLLGMTEFIHKLLGPEGTEQVLIQTAGRATVQGKASDDLLRLLADLRGAYGLN